MDIHFPELRVWKYTFRIYVCADTFSESTCELTRFLDLRICSHIFWISVFADRLSGSQCLQLVSEDNVRDSMIRLI